jgi:hypothetical protein
MWMIRAAKSYYILIWFVNLLHPWENIFFSWTRWRIPLSTRGFCTRRLSSIENYSPAFVLSELRWCQHSYFKPLFSRIWACLGHTDSAPVSHVQNVWPGWLTQTPKIITGETGHWHGLIHILKPKKTTEVNLKHTDEICNEFLKCFKKICSAKT